MKYTEEQLIELLQKLAKELCRTPTSRDLKNAKNYPKYTQYIKHFGVWNNALKEANLKSKEDRNVQYIKNGNFIVSKIIELNDNIKVKCSAKKQNRNGIFWRFKINYEVENYILLAYDFESEKIEHVWKINKNIIEIKNFSINETELNKYKKYEIDSEQFNNVIKLMKEGKILYDKKYFKYSDEDLIQIIQNLSTKLKRPPMKKDLINDNNLPPIKLFKRLGDTWEEILINCNIDSKFMKIKLIDDIHNFVKENGKIPCNNDINNTNGFYSMYIYRKYFGNFTNALHEAEYNRRLITDREHKCSICVF